MERKKAARNLARLIVRSGYDAGDPELHSAKLREVIRESVSCKGSRWIGPFARDVVRKFGGRRPSIARLAEFIFHNRAFSKECEAQVVQVENAPPGTHEMRPAQGAPSAWNLPKILSSGDLARWLNIPPEYLDWFADVKQLERYAPTKLSQYHRSWRVKKDGAYRLIEAPKQRLKSLQRLILKSIIERIPAHDAAHGFQQRRSILTFARPHTAKAIVLKMDVRDFFPSFSFTRIHHLFLAAGYPEAVSKSLAGICTTICPRSQIRKIPSDHWQRARDLYSRKHLPQGAPTSPSLANLCAFNFDCRLAGLAKSAGAAYTRYADDLVFSGDEKFARGIKRFAIYVMAIAFEEGLEINPRKTHVMRRSVAQRAAGVVVNSRPNIPRREYDLLKAILTNAIRHGPDSQNRARVVDFRAHLQGKIAHVFMLNANKGRKLRELFVQIAWA